jgi:uncharacterized protein YdeI (YjbR/CyaY-like superfamily)
VPIGKGWRGDPVATFFETRAEFEAWLEMSHATETELIVGFWKRSTGLASITRPESVDAALCYGWIDGIRRRIDDESSSIRFTPRRTTSIWSRVNVRRAQELIDEGSMRPAGLAAFDARDERRSAIYAHEQSKAVFPEDLAARFQEFKEAWTFFQSQPPSYRQPATWWVISARREETRIRRLERLIDVSANGKRLDALSPNRGVN